MKIFISWSGSRSQKMASSLKGWLSDVFQGDEIFMSDHDIEAGVRWANKLNSELDASKFGIICLTPDNLQAPWLLFEAGALSKSIEGSQVVPYLLNLKSTNIVGPLAQFQGVSADREGTLKLVRSINKVREGNLPEEKLLKSFNKWWADLEAQLQNIPALEDAKNIERTDRALLEEILELLRVKTNAQPIITVQEKYKDLPEILFNNRNIHTYTEDDISKMDIHELKQYIEQINWRSTVTNSLGEYDHLDNKRNMAEMELAKRQKIDGK
jgi:hypothetical protein